MWSCLKSKQQKKLRTPIPHAQEEQTQGWPLSNRSQGLYFFQLLPKPGNMATTTPGSSPPATVRKPWGRALTDSMVHVVPAPQLWACMDEIPLWAQLWTWGGLCLGKGEMGSSSGSLLFHSKVHSADCQKNSLLPLVHPDNIIMQINISVEVSLYPLFMKK